jgi:hypothetical protein
MALQALASAIDLFSAPAAEHPWAAADSAGRETHEALKGYNTALAHMIRARKIKAIEQKNSINASFKTVAKENPELVDQALAQLSETIAGFEALIENTKARLVSQQAAADALLAQAASISVANARLARRAVNKFFELGGDLHNETVEFYYFLLALRAEYDPETRGGPSFDNPKALGDYLREQMKASPRRLRRPAPSCVTLNVWARGSAKAMRLQRLNCLSKIHM